MKALQFYDWKTPAELREVPDPDPGPGQVLVKVAASGACHSDLHVMHEFEPGASRTSCRSIPPEASVATTYWGSVTELAEVVALAERGVLDIHAERFSLAQAMTAYERLERGEIEGRAVVVPG